MSWLSLTSSPRLLYSQSERYMMRMQTCWRSLSAGCREEAEQSYRWLQVATNIELLEWWLRGIQLLLIASSCKWLLLKPSARFAEGKGSWRRLVIRLLLLETCSFPKRSIRGNQTGSSRWSHHDETHSLTWNTSWPLQVFNLSSRNNPPQIRRLSETCEGTCGPNVQVLFSSTKKGRAEKWTVSDEKDKRDQTWSWKLH